MTTLRGYVRQHRDPAEDRTDAPVDPAARDRLRALVLLSGSVRSNPLSLGIGRSVLDLPINAEQTVLDHWQQQVGEMAAELSLEQLPVRVMINRRATPPTIRSNNGQVVMQVEEDASAYRGTAGVLHDVAGDYDDDDLLMVANGAQVMLEPLCALFVALARTRSDISILSHADGTPSSMMLVRCAALRGVADVGFVDLKEQALPQIAAEHAVTVVDRARPVGLPVRGRAEYLLGVSWHHRHQTEDGQKTDPFAEHWQPTFGLIEAGAKVDPSARVHDSVVLDGAEVQRGAVLVQSVVCPGGVVRRHRTVTERLVVANRAQQTVDKQT